MMRNLQSILAAGMVPLFLWGAVDRAISSVLERASPAETPPPAALVVLRIDINNVSNQPVDSGLPARVEALTEALGNRLASCGYRIRSVDPGTQAAADRTPGYLFAHPDLASGLGSAVQADWVIAARLDRATPWGADLQALVVRVKHRVLVSNRTVELKGLELTPELGARLVDRGAAWMADQVSQAIQRSAGADSLHLRPCPA